MGITQHITGVDNVRSCANLVMLTAHIGQPMTGLNPLRGQNNVQGACDVGALARRVLGIPEGRRPGGAEEVRARLVASPARRRRASRSRR